MIKIILNRAKLDKIGIHIWNYCVISYLKPWKREYEKSVQHSCEKLILGVGGWACVLGKHVYERLKGW